MTVETTAGPVPFLKGVFAIYNTPDGGVHISYRPDGAETDEHIQVPGLVMNLVKEMQETGKMPNPIAMFKLMRGA